MLRHVTLSSSLGIPATAIVLDDFGKFMLKALRLGFGYLRQVNSSRRKLQVSMRCLMFKGAARKSIEQFHTADDVPLWVSEEGVFMYFWERINSPFKTYSFHLCLFHSHESVTSTINTITATLVVIA